MEEEVSDRETLTAIYRYTHRERERERKRHGDRKGNLFHALDTLVKNGPLLINQKL